MSRRSLSKRVRFEIFDRDGFTCQYCGKQPPDVTLHVDHIVAFSKGGSDEPENLTTACQDCNLGKSDKTIGEVAGTERDRLRRAQEACESMSVAKVANAAVLARAELRQVATNAICEMTGDSNCEKANSTGVANAINEFGADSTIQWLESAAVAVGRGLAPRETNMMRYFYGILRKQREEAGTTDHE